MFQTADSLMFSMQNLRNLKDLKRHITQTLAMVTLIFLLHAATWNKTCKMMVYDSQMMVSESCIKWAPSSECVSSSIPSWQISTAHVQLFRGARDLAFCLKVPLDSLLVWASSEGSGETARMRRLAWTFAARIGDKYQIRLTRSKWSITALLYN